MKSVALIPLLLILQGCFFNAPVSDPKPSALAVSATEQEYSVYRAGNRYEWGEKDHYVDEVQPVFARRCVTCHSCTAGPCQLNLTSYEGVVRGMSQDNPYDAGLLSEVTLARLEDNHSEATWRAMGFHPVIADTGDPVENENSIMYLALTSGEENRSQPNIYGGDFGQELWRELALKQEAEENQCPVTAEEYHDYRAKNPRARMPYGCPALEDDFLETLKVWLRNGGKGPSPAARQALVTPQTTRATRRDPAELVAEWEAYLNQGDLAHQAVSRYIYEHTWVYNLHFEDNPGEFYRIIRSRTPAPQPIDQIVTDFATDDPGDDVERVFYRLEKVNRLIEMKKHILWRVDQNTIAGLEKIFFKTPWTLDRLPGYPLNPFDWFKAIPVKARAEYVRRHMRLMMQAVGRGSICHGRDPSHVGSDYAWYFILDGDSDPTVLDPTLGMGNYDQFYTHPGQLGSQILPSIVRDPSVYNEAFEKTLRKHMPEGLGLDDIWDEEFFYGLRHETSMEFLSGTKNPVPGLAKYRLIWSYANLEKFYYRTSVHYKWWGSGAHKAEAFAKATHNLARAENIFTSLHPDHNVRNKLRRWLSSLKARTLYGLHKDYAEGRGSKLSASLSYEDISRMLLEKFRGPLTAEVDRFNNWPVKDLEKRIHPVTGNIEQWESGLRTLTGKTTPWARFVPNVVHIRLDGKELYTLFVDRGHNNDRIVTQEKSDRNPEADVVRAIKGYVGPFPHLFIDLKLAEASQFLERFRKVETPGQWVEFANTYKVAKNSDEFWPFVDWLHSWISTNMKAEGGIVDLRNYDLRDEPF